MPRILTAALASLSAAALLTVGLSPSSAVPVHAGAASAVVIHKIPGKTVSASGKAKIAPNITRRGPVSIRSKTITVSKNGERVATRVKSARLTPGRYRVTTTVKYRVRIDWPVRVYSSLRIRTRTQSLTIRARSGSASPTAEPRARTAAPVSGECPSWAPIKGNAQSGIYHVPSARFYPATYAEDCFATEAGARAAGYRRAKV
ncbi:MAG: hypothetical protein LBT54_07705 [Bifidobacteriaceae bacterium]|jgi:hypothetical protein|nr:hypothetical protein [Bifidobacteriaceae bacterium]